MNINKENINLIHVDVFKSKDDLTWSLIFVNVKILKKHIEPLARSCSVLYDPLKLTRVYGCEREKLTFILGIYIHIHPGGIQKLNFSKERMKLK